MDVYAERIMEADDLETLCNIIEDAADDEWITNEAYCVIYALCVTRAQTMGG